MKVLFDTNVILDLLLTRQPFDVPAAQLVAKVERNEITGYLCATTITTIYYLVTKKLDKKRAANAVSNLMQLFEVAAVSRQTLANALALPFPDYEDAVLYEAGRAVGVDAIATRNLTDFAQAQLPTYEPQMLIALLQMS
jgi:predicted nucleic acid-binding protein